MTLLITLSEKLVTQQVTLCNFIWIIQIAN